MAQAGIPSCKSQQGEESKQASNHEDTDGKSMQHEADWTLLSMQSRSRSLPLAPEITLTNSYEALGMQGEGGVDNSAQPEGNKHVKTVRPRNQVRTSATKKKTHTAKGK